MSDLLTSIQNSQFDNLKNNFRPIEALHLVLARLSDRDRWILEMRYGLGKSAPATLEEIGQEVGVTRERVRQIESAIIKKLQKDKAALQSIVIPLEAIMAEFGGIITQEALLKIVAKNYPKHSRHDILAHLNLAMSLYPQAVPLPVKSDFELGWRNKALELDAIRGVADRLRKELDKQKAAAEFEDLINILTDVEPALIQGVLEAFSYFGKDLTGKWGLNAWVSVNPKRIRDKIYEILKQVDKPLHFQEITDHINIFYKSTRPVLSRTVHNELISDDRFVLVGRGIYALKEWGYHSGTVADVIKEILQKAGQPLRAEEIIEEVLKLRQVKPNTVVANLHNKDMFRKVGRATYTLA